MKRKLLIPLDGSDFSLQIVRVVVDFFDPRDMALLLLRIAPPLKMSETVPARTLLDGVGVLSGSYERGEEGDSVLAEALQGMRDQLLAELRPEAERLRELGYTVKTDVQFGDPAQRIMNYASGEGVSLIAMATHGRSGFDRLVMGSVAERVLRNVAVPVLLLRPEAAAVARTAGERLALALGQGGGLRIAVATDGATFGQRAVTLASQLQQLLGGELTVLVTASDREGAGKAQQIMTDTTALLPSTGAGEMRPRVIVPLVGYADEEVLHALQANPVDLLVIGAFADRGAGGANVVGPTAYRILQEVQSTVLLVKGHRQLFRRVLVCAGVEDEALVTVGAQFAQILGAQLDLLHVMPPSAAPYLSTEPGATMDVEAAIAQGTRLSAMLHKWEHKLEAHGFTRSSIVLQPGSVQEVILQRARDTGYDLVVAGSESTPGHFPSSIANTLVRYVDQSVLLVRTRTR